MLGFMTTVAEPLSAGLMMMSLWARSLVRASHMGGVRLSFLLAEIVGRQAFFYTARMYISKAASLFLGQFQVLLFLSVATLQYRSTSVLLI